MLAAWRSFPHNLQDAVDDPAVEVVLCPRPVEAAVHEGPPPIPTPLGWVHNTPCLRTAHRSVAGTFDLGARLPMQEAFVNFNSECLQLHRQSLYVP